MTRLLLTGFEPFGGETINPSWEVALSLAAESWPGTEMLSLRLAVHPERAFAALRDAILAFRPDVILSLGQAGGRAQVTPERVGINVLEFSEVGGNPEERPVVYGGPPAYFTSLPLREMVRAVREQGIPSAISNTAGTYLCNAVAYYTQHLLAEEGLIAAAGFIHLPYLPQQATNRQPAPSMALETMCAGVNAAVTCILTELARTPVQALGV